MFDTVRGHTRVATGRLGTGAAVSIFFHAALLAVAVILGARHPELVAPPERTLTWPDISRTVTIGVPDAPRTPAAPSKPRRTRPGLVAPTVIAPPAPDVPIEIPTTAPPDVAGDGDEVIGQRVGPGLGQPDGDPNAAPNANRGHGGEAIYDLTHQMTQPRMLSGRAPQYTAQALAARVEGTMTVRCVITAAGLVRDCQTIKSVPHMEEEVLQALQSRRYAPVTLDGEPVAVRYLFRIKLTLP